MKKNDFVLIGVLFLIAAVLFIIPLVKEEGAVATVTVDGEVVYELPLTKDAQVCVNTKDDEGINIVTIKDNAVFVEDANCRDRLCVNQGKKSKVGDVIVCLPHKVIIKVTE